MYVCIYQYTFTPKVQAQPTDRPTDRPLTMIDYDLPENETKGEKRGKSYTIYRVLRRPRPAG